MLLYGWSFLAIAMVLVTLAFIGGPSLYVFGVKVWAALFVLLGFFAFALAKGEASR